MDSSTQKRRLISLDVFRGATIAAMILVNTPGTYGAVYRELRHAEWNGWTFTDCIFPFFLFIIGVSLAVSLSRRMAGGEPKLKIEWHVLRRSAILFALGLFLNGFPIFHLSTLRIPGVLQRIALCYLIASTIVINSRILAQVCWTVGLLLVYWLMMQFIPVPEIGHGVYEPGRNFAAYIDSLFLSGHMWAHYETWDPEGIVSTIPAVSTTLFGVLTGHWLSTHHSREKKSVGMFFAGLLLVVTGLTMNVWLPINKNIWTSTYSVFMAGLALTSLGFLSWLIDAKGFKWWTKPFVVFGMNPITVYLLSETLDETLRFLGMTDQSGSYLSLRQFLYRHYFLPLASPINASLLFAVAYLLLMYVVAWIMWRKHWFVKI